MNVCTFVGRVGKDAVTRFTQGGKPITGWSLAVDVGWGEDKQTLWLDCALFGERGEKLAPHILKGDKLGVSGELSTRDHDGKTYVKLNVREVELLAGTRDAEPKQDAAPRAAPQRGGPPKPPPSRDDFEDSQIPF